MLLVIFLTNAGINRNFGFKDAIKNSYKRKLYIENIPEKGYAITNLGVKFIKKEIGK